MIISENAAIFDTFDEASTAADQSGGQAEHHGPHVNVVRMPDGEFLRKPEVLTLQTKLAADIIVDALSAIDTTLQRLTIEPTPDGHVIRAPNNELRARARDAMRWLSRNLAPR